MTFLKFTTEQAAIDAAVTISINFDCPIDNGGGYEMTKWADPTKAYNLNIWYFQKPEDGRRGLTIAQLMNNVVGYEEISAIDPNWLEPISI